ncbi:hypothetical protein Esti_001090 [Eimeria stiedai]
MQRQPIKEARLPLSATLSSDNGEGHASRDASPTHVGSGGLLFNVLLDLDALVASLKACEVAADATQAISKRILSDSLMEGVHQMIADKVRVPLASLGDMALLDAMPDDAAASSVTLRTHQQASVDQHLLEDTPSLRASWGALSELSSEGSKRDNTSANNQQGASIPSGCDDPSFSPPSHDSNFLEDRRTCMVTRGCKRCRETESSTTDCPQHNLDPAFNRMHEEERRHGCKDVASATPSSLVKLSPNISTYNALEDSNILKRRRGAAKQSRMSRRLESFRREAEEALRGQQNAVVISIFSLIDGQTRRLRGGTMTPSELDLRIMMVIDRCLPLKGSEAKAVEAVLNMAAVRKLKASLEGVPRTKGTFLDLVTLSKVCKHIPGVCFDKWNLGWIATWREDRRPVHKHFSAKKYGFFRAREFAICYRSRMTSDLPLDGATYPASRRALLARGDLTPLLSDSTETVNETLARWQVETEGLCRARRAGNAAGAAGPILMEATLATAKKVEDGRASSANAQPSAASLECGAVAAAVPSNGGVAAAAPRGKEQQEQSQVVARKADDVVQEDIFVSRDGWADLVSRTPKVERVSFDFTNQSWIAQWKQQGKTTYRRFAVSKYGFSTAHRLAVEYKSKHFKESIQPCGSTSSTAFTSDNATDAPSANATLGGTDHGPLPKQQQPAAAARGTRLVQKRGLARRSPAEIHDGLASSASERETRWGHTEPLRNTQAKQEQQQQQVEGDRGLLSQHEEQLGHQENLAFEAGASNSSAHEREMQQLDTHTGTSSRGLACASGFGTLPGKAGAVDLDALEALFCSHPEVGEMLGCSMARESAAGGRGVDGTTTTATPTNHTHASVDAFPVNAVAPSGQQAAQTGHSPPEPDEAQVQTGLQQQAQQLLDELLRLSGEMKQHKQHEQVHEGYLASAPGLEASLAPPGNQQETSSLSSLEMTKAAIKCMLLDLEAMCLQDKSLSKSGGVARAKLVKFHLTIIDELPHLEGLRPYGDLLAPCIEGNGLPSALPEAVRNEILQGLESLSITQQQTCMRHLQLVDLFEEHMKQKRQLHQLVEHKV